MALPKRKHSKARTRRRRALYRVKVPPLMRCPKCGAAILPHNACRKCGSYKGVEVMHVRDRSKKGEQKKSE